MASSDDSGWSRREMLQRLAMGLALPTLGLGCAGETLGSDVLPQLDSTDAEVDLATRQQLLAQIDTFVVLCLENRSFDHVLGSRRVLEGLPVEGLRGTEFNLDPRGARVPVHALPQFTLTDPAHSWNQTRAQWNHGRNDGFVTSHAGPEEQDVMGFYTRSQLPITYALADASATCDRWFSSVMGPTWPNRFYLHGATADGRKSNLPTGFFENIFRSMTRANLSNVNYFHDVPWAAAAYLKTAGFAPAERFFTDAAAGILPRYSLIDPSFFGATANDDHPHHDSALAQALIASVYAALAQSPQWKRTLLVVTYDEHGGFYDHVSPPTTVDQRVDFQQLGFRVPSIVAGPYVKAGKTVHTAFEHVSVLSTLTNRYQLPPLNERVTRSSDLSSCLDPRLLGRAPKDPVQLPVIEVSRRLLSPEAAGSAGPAEHPELQDALAKAPLASSLDRRREGQDIAARVLQKGVELGAVRLVD